MKIFVLGLPGCGKSTAVHCITEIAREHGWTIKHFNDYNILRKWFEEEPDGPRFRPTTYGGFDIRDFTVFDIALEKLEQTVLQEVSTSTKEVAIVEFARASYLKAFQLFSASFLQDAYILCIDADIATCKKRVRYRAKHQYSSDDHYVSKYIFNAYYRKGSGFCKVEELNKKRDRNGIYYSLNSQRVRFIDNSARIAKEQFCGAIRSFTLANIVKESVQDTKISTLEVGVSSRLQHLLNNTVEYLLCLLNFFF